MTENILFSLALLSQIIVVSIWLPSRIKANAKHLLDTHPQSDYPRLYPKSPAHYERALVHFSWINWAIVLVGGFFWIVFVSDATNGDYAGVAWALFMLQSVPFVLLEFFTFRTWKFMRDADTRTVRTATLRARKLTDIVSVTQLTMLVAAYLLFGLFTAYISQFDLTWFSAGANLAVLGGGYCLLGAIVCWHWFGGRRDPYLDESDHINRIRFLVRQAVLVCIALTAYAMVKIALQAFELREFKQLAMSVYCQLLAVGAYFSVYQQTTTNFDVYREQPTPRPGT